MNYLFYLNFFNIWYYLIFIGHLYFFHGNGLFRQFAHFYVSILKANLKEHSVFYGNQTVNFVVNKFVLLLCL